MPKQMTDPTPISQDLVTFPHAMLREIYEQPQALAATIEQYVPGGLSTAETFQPVVDALGGRERLVIAASGSSRHAGLAGEIMLEDLTGISVDVEYASEYTYRSTHTLHNPGVVVISQSGETADTLAALREAHARGLTTVAITNNADSSMATEASASLPTFAGVEKAIPATKSFTTQLAVLYSLALHLARVRGRMTLQTAEAHGRQLREIPDLLQGALPGWQKQIEALTPQLASSSTLLYLGRGAHYAIAREGALKLKESAYLNAEGYPSGELKHGPNALVSKDSPLIMIATADAGDPDSLLRYSKVLQLMKDMRAQGARIIALATEGDQDVPQCSDSCLFIPPSNDLLSTILEVVPFQLLAYTLAISRGIDVDRPRNLVKAVIEE
ncbi:SIS domain-containing protein [Tunturiibacter psychrotolerans]|jgi:glutamine---fructose-6-phosphate transaminase (isomerizing)|uniref:SIS domain-containing protein n=1 Tax=Tunturiibacter psychrotolerans TaxID=3069686 RepID=UPI003D1B6103